MEASSNIAKVSEDKCVEDQEVQIAGKEALAVVAGEGDGWVD